MKHIRSILVLAAGLTLCSSASAAILRTEQFVGYGTGNVGADATLGQLNGWNLATAEITTTNGEVSLDGVPLGLVASEGSRAFVSATTNAVVGARNQIVPASSFPQANDTNIYVSLLYRFRNAADVSPDGELIMRMNRGNSGLGTAQHWDLLARNVGGNIEVGIFKVGATTTNYATTNIAAGQTIFIVVRQHIIPGAANDVYDLWIDPPSASFGATEENIPPSAASISEGTEDSSGTGPGRLVFVAGANSEFDEFRATTSWAEATPPAGQCVAAGITTSPTNITMSAELAATFRVTEAGTAPTFQWQVSTDSGGSWQNVSNGNTFIYTTPNLPMSADGWQYRAIVGVPCDGSFATSEVATVTLIAPTPTPRGVVMNDTFTDPDLGFDDRSNPPLNSSNSLWYTATSANLFTLDQGGNMVALTAAGASTLYVGYFTEEGAVTHLSVGDAIRVTLPFKPGGTIGTDTGSPLRFGIFDYFDGGIRFVADGAGVGGSTGNGANVRGYMVNLHFRDILTDETPIEILARTTLTDINLIGTTGSYTSLGSGPSGLVTNTTAFQADVEYNFQITVARTAENTAVITASIVGGTINWSFSVTDTNYVYHRFDSVAMRPNSQESTATQFTFPEFKVDVIEAAVPIVPFNITAVRLDSPNALALTWDSINGVNYRIESRDSLTTGNWVTNATVQASGTSTSYTNPPAAGSQGYYRVVAQ